MDLTLPTLLMLLLMAGVGVCMLSTVASVIRTESSFWNIRCEVEKLRYSYQLQLMRAANGETDGHPGEIIEVAPIDAAPIEVSEVAPGD